MEAIIQNQDGNFSRKPPNSNRAKAVNVLLIGRDAVLSLFTDEVLKQAGFVVDFISPWQAKELFHDGNPVYRVVILSHTLYPDDISEIEILVRRRCPGSNLLLMLGPDSMPVNSAKFDHVLEGLDGPVALIQAVRQLSATTASASDKTQDGSSAMLA